jgi:UDP-N-acetylmuramoyl-tripeptide--D-alanyl-D-alanine ligase
MIANALAAATVGHLLGLPLEMIKDGLEQVTAEGGRMAVIRTAGDITIVDDAYNANPASMQAAFDALGSLRGGRRAALVLGDMLELGREAADWHRKIGAAAARSGADRIYFFGNHAGQAAESARRERALAGDVVTGSQTEIIADLKAWLASGDWVLVKGSRGMRMDRIVSELKAWADSPGK